MARAGGNPDLAKYGEPYRFTKDNQPPAEKKGPKKNRIKDYIEENDLSAADIGAMIRALADIDEEKLKEIVKDKKAPILVRLYAIAIAKDMENGRVYNAETILSRAIGSPKQIIDVEVKNVIVKKPDFKNFKKESDDEPGSD